MDLIEHFRQYLVAIRPTAEQKRDARDAHRRLRERLVADEALDKHVLTTLLQGSYRRSTDIRPVGEKKSDVDIVVVTNMSEDDYTPERALERFQPFLEAHYEGCYEQQDRSWGIVDGEVELDLVPTSAPSEAVREELKSLREADAAVEPGLEQYGIIRKALSAATSMMKEAAFAKGDAWREEPLRIPDRARRHWRDTHPIAQIEWTQDKNESCNRYYVDVVRSVKWTWLTRAGEVHPKGYPLEALVGVHCPDGIRSVAQGIVETLEAIVAKTVRQVKPEVWDHGVRQDVFQRVTAQEWAAFYDTISALAPNARAAYDEQDRQRSSALWCDVLGPAFPKDDDDDDGGGGNERGFQPPSGPPSSAGQPRRFA